MKATKICCWIIIVLAVGFTIYGWVSGGSDEYYVIRRALRKLPLILSLVGVSCMFYYFFHDVIFQKSKQKCLCSLIGMCILIVLSVGIYFATHNSHGVVYMKEDVMYVKPISNTK
jgi:hypothetical protein